MTSYRDLSSGKWRIRRIVLQICEKRPIPLFGNLADQLVDQPISLEYRGVVEGFLPVTGGRGSVAEASRIAMKAILRVNPSAQSYSTT